MFCPMSPPIDESIRKVAPHTWLLGTSMICEMNSEPSEHALVSWKDEEGLTYIIRRVLDVETPFRQPLEGNDTCDSKLFHTAGTSSAVWLLGGVFFKVKAWTANLSSEYDTISFVRTSKSSRLLPDVVYTWIDPEWDRSFLVVRRVNGVTLKEAWDSLSETQRQGIADTVAECCIDLASLESSKLESHGGYGVLEPFLARDAPVEEPSWRPQPLGPFSYTQMIEYLAALGKPISIEPGRAFLFYHADLGPTNIIISAQGRVNGIIDWESAAYYPRFWLATKPLVSAGFNLGGEDKYAWAKLLSRTLESKGYPSDINLYRQWKAASGR